MGRLRGAAGSTRARGRRGRGRCRRVQDECAGADRDRLGVRLEGRDGAVRRTGARGGAAARQAAEREGRRRRTALPDQDLRHAGQQAGDGQVLRGEPARRQGRRHLHDLRRRFRRAGRAGGDQPRQARCRPVHRDRPDGPEALRRQGQARVQLRQRRPGRGLGNGRVRLASRLAGRGARNRHGDRLLQGRRQGVRGPLEAARRQDRRQGELPVAREHERPERREPTQRRQGRRDRHLDRRRVRRALDAGLRPADARQQHRDPQLVGG